MDDITAKIQRRVFDLAKTLIDIGDDSSSMEQLLGILHKSTDDACFDRFVAGAEGTELLLRSITKGRFGIRTVLAETGCCEPLRNNDRSVNDLLAKIGAVLMATAENGLHAFDMLGKAMTLPLTIYTATERLGGEMHDGENLWLSERELLALPGFTPDEKAAGLIASYPRIAATILAQPEKAPSSRFKPV